VIWVKDAPKFGVNVDSEVCPFIEKHISCGIPKEEGKLKELVLLLQQHKHSSYCKKNKKCQFNFPHPPSSKTLIAEPESDPSIIEGFSGGLRVGLSLLFLINFRNNRQYWE